MRTIMFSSWLPQTFTKTCFKTSGRKYNVVTNYLFLTYDSVKLNKQAMCRRWQFGLLAAVCLQNFHLYSSRPYQKQSVAQETSSVDLEQVNISHSTDCKQCRVSFLVDYYHSNIHSIIIKIDSMPCNCHLMVSHCEKLRWDPNSSSLVILESQHPVFYDKRRDDLWMGKELQEPRVWVFFIPSLLEIWNPTTVFFPSLAPWDGAPEPGPHSRNTVDHAKALGSLFLESFGMRVR